MNGTTLLALKGILLAIHKLSGSALALLEGEDDAAASALEKVGQMPRTFGEHLNETNNGE